MNFAVNSYIQLKGPFQMVIGVTDQAGIHWCSIFYLLHGLALWKGDMRRKEKAGQHTYTLIFVNPAAFDEKIFDAMPRKFHAIHQFWTYSHLLQIQNQI